MPSLLPRLLLLLLLGGLLAGNGVRAEGETFSDTPQGQIDPIREDVPPADAATEATADANRGSAAGAVPPGTEEPPRPRRTRLGYAFNHPRVLAQQAIFGISHGVALLARTCALVPASAAASNAAYAAWTDKNQVRIETAERELARYYFAPPRDGVRRLHLVQALQLKAELGLATDSPELREACATLPQALQNPRYDLEALWLLRRDTERLRRATETRELLAQCRQQAELEAVEKVDAALARWEEDNAALETAARERLLADPGNNPAPGAQGADDNAKALEHWQEELRQAVRRRFTYAKPDHPTPCAGLDEAGAMQGPDYALTRAFDEDKNP